MKKIIKNSLIFLSLLIVVFTINYFFIHVNMDEVWTYGFSYNITEGLVPYRDFNMIVLPFHTSFIALLMLIFGNSFLIYHIICATIVSSILYYVSKKIGYFKAMLLAIYFFVFEVAYFYNVFIALSLILILCIEESSYKYNDLLISLLIGSIMMTKANIGAFLFLVFFFKSKHKLRDFLYTAIIPFIVLMYLIFSGNLMYCIDYCFMGMKSFKDNYYFDLSCTLIAIASIIYMIIKVRKTKDNNYYYLLAFMLLCYPICDLNHVFVAIYPMFFYMLLKVKDKRYKLLIYSLIIMLAISYFTTRGFSHPILEDSILGYRIYEDEDDIKKYEEYMKNNPDKTYFFFNGFAYLVKLDVGVPVNKYDLINRGNMGHDDYLYLKEIENICNKEDCRIMGGFREFNFEYTQLLQEYREYVLKNYELCYGDFVYCKKKVFCRSSEKQ